VGGDSRIRSNGKPVETDDAMTRQIIKRFMRNGRLQIGT
jgi:hypothetical protein